MNYKIIGMIAVSVFFTIMMGGLINLTLDLVMYSTIGMIVSGFAVLAYGFGSGDLRGNKEIEDSLEKIKQLETRLSELTSHDKVKMD